VAAMRRRIRPFSGALFDGLVYLVMVLVILACLVPFVTMIALSLSSPAAVINNRVTLWPVGLNAQAYRQIFAYPNFLHAYGNTIFYTVAGTAIALVLTIMFAYPLSKPVVKGRGVVMKLVIFSMFFSGGLIPNYLLVSSLRLTNTVWAMLIPFAISQFNLIILMNFFRAVPAELEEAAFIDGLDYARILTRIVVPLSTAALATVGLYTAVFFWNDWFHGLIYLKSTQFPVMLFLRNIVTGTSMAGDAAGAGDKSSVEISIKSAVIITSTLPIIVVYPFLQRYFVKGMLLGSVKG
jgi:putative aldouronate transport system permease protein